MFKKLRSLYFSLYEVTLELQKLESNSTEIQDSNYFDYLENLQLRKQDLEDKINNLLGGS